MINEPPNDAPVGVVGLGLMGSRTRATVTAAKAARYICSGPRPRPPNEGAEQ